MTNVQFFGYKSLIYEPNYTKFYMNMKTIAAHKPREFRKYWLKELPLWGEKVPKSSKKISSRQSPNTGDWGQFFQGTTPCQVRPKSVQWFAPTR